MSAAEEFFDLFVIGGGINGAAIACDAAGRGLTVGIADMRDFAEGTSSRSSKLIHGGLRYLETYDFKLVRDALIEREILLHKAPHLVRPLRLILPHVAAQRPRWMIRIGLLLYDHLADRQVLEASESINLAAHPAGVALKPEFRHAFAYSDCYGDDSRLVIANLLGAEKHGAKVYPRHAFLNAARSGDHWRLELKRLSSGEAFGVRAKALVNAGGPWVIDVTRNIADVAVNRRLRMVRGSHIVVPRQWAGDQGYFLQTRDGRLMEAIPFERDFTSIGTTDEPWDEAPDRVTISGKEIDYMLAEVNAFLRKPVTRNEIVWSYSGVRPLFEVGGRRDNELSTLTRDYSFELDHGNGRAPALIIFGGKLTTHRRLAEHAIQRLGAVLSWPKRGTTRTEVLPGGDFGMEGMVGYEQALEARFPWMPAAQVTRYVQQFGSRCDELLAGVRCIEDLGVPFGADLYQREVDFLMRTEWASAAEDVVWRRSKLGLRLVSDEINRLEAYMASTRQVSPASGH